MSLAPITEEDKPAIESMIKKLKRFRKRYAEHKHRANDGSSYQSIELDEAINMLIDFGAMQEWWKFHDD